MSLSDAKVAGYGHFILNMDGGTHFMVYRILPLQRKEGFSSLLITSTFCAITVTSFIDY